MREDALKYAGRGLRVLPLVPKGKKPPFKTGKLHAAASRDPTKINDWFPDGTRHNLGTVAGPDEFDGRGLFALDVDGPDGVAELSTVPPVCVTSCPIGEVSAGSGEASAT